VQPRNPPQEQNIVNLTVCNLLRILPEYSIPKLAINPQDGNSDGSGTHLVRGVFHNSIFLLGPSSDHLEACKEPDVPPFSAFARTCKTFTVALSSSLLANETFPATDVLASGPSKEKQALVTGIEPTEDFDSEAWDELDVAGKLDLPWATGDEHDRASSQSSSTLSSKSTTKRTLSEAELEDYRDEDVSPSASPGRIIHARGTSNSSSAYKIRIKTISSGMRSLSIFTKGNCGIDEPTALPDIIQMKTNPG